MYRSRIAVAVLLLLVSSTAAAQQTVFVVRHAERADGGGANKGMMAEDPELSRAGHARAEALARMLRDAKVRAIVTTEYKRTQQTAAPLAKALGIQPTVIPAGDGAALTGRIKATDGNVLVIGHSNTVPAAVRSLGVTEDVAIGEQDFDNLLVIVLDPGPALVRLRY